MRPIYILILILLFFSCKEESVTPDTIPVSDDPVEDTVVVVVPPVETVPFPDDPAIPDLNDNCLLIHTQITSYGSTKERKYGYENASSPKNIST